MPDTFVKVKYGDEKVLLCNTNCRNDILLKNIKKRCGYEFPEDVELCDENGRVKQLLSNLQDYAIAHCTEREVLVLLQVLKANNEVQYVPMDLTLQKNKDFLERLNVKVKKNNLRQTSITEAPVRSVKQAKQTSGATKVKHSSPTRRGSTSTPKQLQ